jgi:hypothetical protein
VANILIFLLYQRTGEFCFDEFVVFVIVCVIVCVIVFVIVCVIVCGIVCGMGASHVHQKTVEHPVGRTKEARL